MLTRDLSLSNAKDQGQKLEWKQTDGHDRLQYLAVMRSVYFMPQFSCTKDISAILLGSVLNGHALYCYISKLCDTSNFALPIGSRMTLPICLSDLYV